MNDRKSFEDKLRLQLFVSGMSVKSMEAIENIKQLCSDQIEGSYVLEVVDIYKFPEMAKENQIVFSPSLIKHFPLPKKTLIGTLSNSEKVKKILGFSSTK